MSVLKTHISISCDVYPELFATLNAISNPHKRAELIKTLAEDGRRWRAGAYAQTGTAPTAGSTPLPDAQKGAVILGDHTEFRVPEAAVADALDLDW